MARLIKEGKIPYEEEKKYIVRCSNCNSIIETHLKERSWKVEVDPFLYVDCPLCDKEIMILEKVMDLHNIGLF